MAALQLCVKRNGMLDAAGKMSDFLKKNQPFVMLHKIRDCAINFPVSIFSAITNLFFCIAFEVATLNGEISSEKVDSMRLLQCLQHIVFLANHYKVAHNTLSGLKAFKFVSQRFNCLSVLFNSHLLRCASLQESTTYY